MKYLITGGNKGLGQHLTERYQATSLSRQTGFDIHLDAEKIANLSLDYDILINNAYDGAFGQTQVLHAVASLWKQHNKSGHIINIGGVGSEDTSPPFPGWETYNASKRSLKQLSLQWTQAYRLDQVKFRTSLLTVDRLDTPFGRTTPEWTGNGVNLENVAEMIDLCLSVKPNTCIGEIKCWVNLDYQT